ncbi:uncharacterized protein CBL_01785 [Carabus blaptoides fortunei]
MVQANVTSDRRTDEQKNEVSSSGASRSKHVLRDIALHKLRSSVKEIQQDVVRRVHDELDSMVHDVLSVVEKSPALADNVNNLFNNHAHSATEKKRPSERVFVARPSLLTELFEVKHIRSIYHMFLAVLIIALVNNIATDVLNGAGVRLGLRYVHIGFGKLGWALGLWACMFCCTVLVYPVYCTWAEYRPNCRFIRLWDGLYSLVLATYVCAFATIPPYMKGYDMPVASAAVVLLEQTRLLMKVHAFIRSQTPHVLNHTKPLPGFERFLYFIFAPTLIYRDTYPRTKCIRWWFVTVRLLEVLGAILLISFIVEHYLVPQYGSFGVEQHTWSTLATSVFRTMLPGTLILLCGFYLLLHAWLNGWAETLRFADRQFYRDWWNAASYGEYYRTWNFFGLGMAFSFVKYNSDVGNIFLWTTLAIGTGVQVSFYSMELCARLNCAQVDDTWWDLFVPRSWSCHGLT